MARSKQRPRRNAITPARSAKAGRPPQEAVSSPRVRRRSKTAYGAVKKDSMLLQTDDGPRVQWAVTKPKIKKR